MTFSTKYYAQKDKFPQKLPLLKQRNKILADIKDFFAKDDFIEVDTPILQLSPGMEVHLTAFDTKFVNLNGAPEQELHLHTSPEFAMKKLLSFGLPKIYQFAHVFRNEIVSPTHYPEFTMLEWYRADTDYKTLMDDCDKIIALAADQYEHDGKICQSVPAERITIAEAFEKFCHFDIYATIEEGLPTNKIAAAAYALNVSISKSDSWDDIYEKLMMEFIEPNLGIGKPTILYEYPLHQAALSRPKSDEPNKAERFEFYVCGVELANAFSELTDAETQAKRFANDMAEKCKLYGIDYPMDNEFLEAVANLPKCAGIAMGIDRLIMLATGAKDIQDVIWTTIPDLSQ